MYAYEIGVKVENLVWEIKDNLRTQIEKELKEELKTTLKAELTIGIIVRMLKKNKYIVLSVQLMVFFRNFASILGELYPN